MVPIPMAGARNLNHKPLNEILSKTGKAARRAERTTEFTGT